MKPNPDPRIQALSIIVSVNGELNLVTVDKKFAQTILKIATQLHRGPLPITPFKGFETVVDEPEEER